MARIRKTISFKESVHKEIETRRGGKTFSTFLNEFLEEKLNTNKLKGGKSKK